MFDYYPTRKAEKSSIIDRVDPVCINDFPEYEKDGFVVLKNFFSGKEFDFISRISTLAEFSKSAYHVKDLNLSDKRSTLGFHLDSYFDEKSSFMKKLVGYVEGVIGDTYIHQSRINYKRGKDANGWFPHSDFETWHAQDGMPRMMCLSAMIPITKNRVTNGCLNVAPGTHKKFFSAKKEPRASHESNFVNQSEGVPTYADIENLIYKSDGSDFIPVECNPKDLVLFDCNLLHSSYGNTTGEDRKNMFFVFNSINNKLVKPFSGVEERSLFMGAR